MGFIDKGIGKARMRQKESLLKEAQAAGMAIVAFDEVANDAKATGGAMGGVLKTFVGGNLAVDCVQVMRLETGGWSHAYVQPYSGVTALPGEHHGLLHGGIAAPAVLRRGGLGSAFAGLLSSCKWESPAHPGVAQFLTSAPGLAAVAKATKWEWATGLSKVELDWGIQLRGVGDGTTHVALQSGRYGGITTYHVGFGHFIALCQALPACLDPAGSTAQEFIEPAPLAAYVFGAPQAAAPPPGPAPYDPAAAAASAAQAPEGVRVDIDYVAAVRDALSPHLGKKVWFGTVPPKQLGNINKHVIPLELQGSHVVAGIDLTTFGSAKDAIVVTPTHLIAKEFDEVLTLSLSTIRAVTGAQGLTSSKVGIVVDGVGDLSIPVGIDVEPVLALLSGIAAANGGGAGTPVHASAFVGDGPVEVSREQAMHLMQQMQSSVTADSVDGKVNAAAQLLLGGQYQACIDAYNLICQQHPEQAGTCYGQIGAALFFLKRYPEAIQYYQAAKQYGADATMMDENIAEAQGYLR